jgi:hypothetical protein
MVRGRFRRKLSAPVFTAVVVAMANKLARIAWAVLSSGEDYRPVANSLAA